MNNNSSCTAKLEVAMSKFNDNFSTMLSDKDILNYSLKDIHNVNDIVDNLATTLDSLAPSISDYDNSLDTVHIESNQTMWPTQPTSQLKPTDNTIGSLNAIYSLSPSYMTLGIKEEWPMEYHQKKNYTFQPTPTTSINFFNNLDKTNISLEQFKVPSEEFILFENNQLPNSDEITQTPYQSGYDSPENNPSGSLQSNPNHPVQESKLLVKRRKSIDKDPKVTRTHRRKSSHFSVASFVSLSLHEPEMKKIDGVEYIEFLYSHDRNIKQYTVCTDIDRVNLDDIPSDFRIKSAVYPRANVPKDRYDGNRWEYESSCNQLGWKLCWLNKDQLNGRRGLIQRAVDSYRNCHPEMRSRRVARQEKIANGTLRKRRSKRLTSIAF